MARIREILAELSAIREQLRPFNIRDEGGYAEILIADALGGTRNVSGVERGNDVLAPTYGLVEVRSRTLPASGRIETRIRVDNKKWNHFAWLAGVIFKTDISIHAAFLVTHDGARELTNNTYQRFTLVDARKHATYVDITEKVRKAAEKY